MGNVKDRYFKYSENGDQFVGRCISMLPVLHVDFAISPPYFSDDVDLSWLQGMVSAQFCAIHNINEFGLLLRRSLASLLHHCGWIDQFLGFNHVVKTSSICFRGRADIKKVTDGEWIKLSHPCKLVGKDILKDGD
jgi:hypothetical protein